MNENNADKHQYEMSSEMREACKVVAESDVALADVAEALLDEFGWEDEE